MRYLSSVPMSRPDDQIDEQVGLPLGRKRPLTLEAVYRNHFDFVYRKALRLGGPRVDAEDVAQEVFLIVARKLETFDGSSQLTTWLYGITLNVVRAARRRQRLLGWFESKQALPLEIPIETIDRAEVRAAHRIAYEILDKMSAKKREVFILAEFEGLGCDEIARIVDTKTETVWSRLHYAREEFSQAVARRHKKEAP
jgi:RNA polymerase sigma-70 factor (ECF subfamily)